MDKLKLMPILAALIGLVAVGAAVLNLGAPLVFAVVSVTFAILSLLDRS